MITEDIKAKMKQEVEEWLNPPILSAPMPTTTIPTLRDYIESLDGVSVVYNATNIIDPMTIDIYFPDVKVAIEFDKIAERSDLSGQDRHYRVNKAAKCREQGIRLIFVYENEWVNKTEIVKSRISSLVHKNKTIYARKCSIVDINSKQYSKFFNETHIQGSAGASVAYGLVHNGELVAVLSLGKSRFNKNVEYELIRYANSLYTNVVGGGSRLFQHFIKQRNPESVISYTDLRWNTGNLYVQLGFTHTHDANPNYFYFHKSNPLFLQSRQTYQKHKLPAKLNPFDIKMTEWENMILNNFDRVWDCGNGVFLWRREDHI
ncbi:hypothetical protein M0R04_07065 [Candidatus Dojkabacteria bacterium]|jgi:hypothetical protein|nr:hypothetical protein [Candidatus Dojkabacteria bacterium]